MSGSYLYIILGILTVWLIVLTTLYILERKFLSRFTKDYTEKELKKILADILDKQKKNIKSTDDLKEALDQYKVEGMRHLQRFSLVRFNPFQETGGDHSFSVAILDGNKDGFVMTGLHTRERTRVYSKPVVNGKSELDLSKEESQALKNAQK